MGRVHWIPANPDEPILISAQPSAPAYNDMKEYVGGYIEFVTVLFNGHQEQMIVNEEGILLDLPKNDRATEVYWALSKSQGYDLGNQEDRLRLQRDWQQDMKDRFPGLTLETIISIDPRGEDAAPVIQGNAIVLEGIRLD